MIYGGAKGMKNFVMYTLGTGVGSGIVVNGKLVYGADGFAGEDPVISPGNAAHRPMGLAVGADGSLYISDSVKGKIWRVFYE